MMGSLGGRVILNKRSTKLAKGQLGTVQPKATGLDVLCAYRMAETHILKNDYPDKMPMRFNSKA